MTKRHEWTTLQEHLAQEHQRSPFQKYLKEIVYGGNDGIVTTFAVVAGFAGAGGSDSIVAMSTGAVLLFGLANLFADAASMGLGNYLSVRSEQDAYKTEKHKEKKEIQTNPEMEQVESLEILVSKGFTREDATQLVNIYMKNPSYWLEFMMKDELQIEDPTGDKPVYTGIATATAFIAFGSIPLWPYILLHNNDVFRISIAATFTALFLLGILRWRVTQQSPIRSVAEVMLIGGLSASIAYIVGTFFG